MTAQQVIRTYLTITGLFTGALALIWGVNTLFLLQAGLDIFHVMLVNAAFSFAEFVFEVPTGVVADTLGRKASLLFCLVTLLVATLAYVALPLVHGGFWPFVAVSILLGLGFTFWSGAGEAWLVDALKYLNYDQPIERVFAKSQVTFGVAMLIGTTLGGFLGQLDLSVPYYVRAALLIPLIVITLTRVKDLGVQTRALRLAEVPTEMKSVLAKGMRYGLAHPVVRPLMLAAAVANTFMMFGFYSWQRYFLDLLGKELVWVNGVVAAAVGAGVDRRQPVDGARGARHRLAHGRAHCRGRRAHGDDLPVRARVQLRGRGRAVPRQQHRVGRRGSHSAGDDQRAHSFRRARDHLVDRLAVRRAWVGRRAVGLGLPVAPAWHRDRVGRGGGVPGAGHPVLPARASRRSDGRSYRGASAPARGGGAMTLPGGTLTFVFTDIEGSTRLVQELGEARFHAVLEDHGRIVSGALDAEGGHRVRMEGDSFFYVFDRATAAVAAVAAAQRALAGHAFPDGATIRVRMGLHTGEASVGSAATGADYVGYDVHRAARIASAGHGGQVLLSESVSLLVRDGLPLGVTLRDLGEHRFKDLGRAERVFQLVIPDLPADFPRIRSLDAVPNNLPTQVTSFIGREHEIAEGIRLFAGTRLLTLTGPGGTGKTRLSLQIAAQVASGFVGGVTFVPLAPVSDPDLVASAIVDALAIETGQSSPRDRLVQHLKDRQALLIVDNFEQVLPAASLVADLLRACAGLKVIVSSRGPLRVSGEQELPVPPLGLPDPGESPERVSQYEAVRLFIERAVAVKPGFTVNNDNAPAVAEICARLDGLPLAIELAAACVRLLPPAAILTRLANRLGLLRSGARDLPDRQKTLRGAIAWSHDLLDEPSRRLFARLAVFADGGRLTDVEAICDDDQLGIDVLGGLELLVDQALVRQEEDEGEPRALMLETIREFALERLGESPDAEALRERHARRYLALAEEAAPHILHVERRAWLGRLDREHENLRAAFDFCAGSGRLDEAMRIAGALWRFWQFRGHLREGLQRVRRVLDDPASHDHPRARELALEAAGGLGYWLGEMDETIGYYAESVALARANGEPKRIANALYNLTFLPVWAQKDRPLSDRARDADAWSDEALAIAREIGDRGLIARCLWGRANNLRYLHEDPLAGIKPLEEAIPMFRAEGDHFGLAWALHGLGIALLVKGDLPAARAAFEEQTALLGEAVDPSGMAIALADLAQLALAEGERTRAIRLAGASAALRRLTGAELATMVDIVEGRSLEPTPADDMPWSEGLAMTFDQAVAYALGKPAPG